MEMVQRNIRTTTVLWGILGRLYIYKHIYTDAAGNKEQL